ncbi:MAG: rhodanese-like domain-containing protein [Alphaproteobacteria bacterium]|nr:rhodanese-like domain-containing protein [Alphaproteobacteria bacterium]
MVKNVTAPELKEWLDANQAILIDVREPAEYKAEHIPGAILLPLANISRDNLPPYAGEKLVFQCRSGKRGGMACEKITGIDAAADIYNLDGGIVAWTQAGYKVETSGKFFLPLDRQVQLTIGLSVLLSSFLAYAVHPAFLLVTGFFGLGLTFAGLTGFCGLALLMAKMPWNQDNAGVTTISCHTR